MVMQKRLDYGFNGYQVPPTPRAARSARRRSLFKRKTDDNQMCAFDLLATVAGKLLLDGESCPPSANTSTGKDQPATWGDSIAKEVKDENKPSNEMPCGQVCYERNFLITELVSKAPNPNVSSNEIMCTQNDAISIPASVITTSDCLEKVGSAKQLVDDDCKLSLSIFPTVDADSSGFKPSLSFGLEDENRKQVKMDSGNTRNFEAGNKASLYSSWHVEAWDKKPDALVSSGDSLKFPLRKDHTPCGSVPANRDNVKIGKIDDDENSDCTEAYTSSKAFTSPQHVGDRRIRKFLDSKNCKATPIVKDGEQFNADAERSNLNNSKRQRSPRDYPFKKRKLYGCSSGSNSDEGIGSNESCREPENGTGESGLDLCPTLPGATSSPTSAAGGHASLNTRNAQVKLKIKSFRVPELFIEIPETATVGSMKRAVMEAIGSLLGSGLRVGVLLQGKRIRDDNKTLLQTGISHEDKMDSLGFTLEPSSNTTTPIRSNSLDKMLCESPQPLGRYPPTLSITENACHLGNLYTRPELNRTSLKNLIERDHDSAPSHPGTSSSQKTPSESKALVLVPPRKQDSLAVVPLRKSKRSECAQRRIRRPFTVAEVEALVQAVEKLGTGRWRDVKLRAFDNAKHRTYVDLKDKWKTLVHTARISPQQRRGEPVPQELLDRVLTAHAYWSQQQAKQQLKSHPGTCLLL